MQNPYEWLQEQIQSAGYRSSGLATIQWLIGILLSGSVALFCAKAPDKFAAAPMVMALLLVPVYIIAYFLWYKHDKDGLRSERFAIQKLAIQKGLIGDDTHGLKRVSGKDVESKTALIDDLTDEDEKQIDSRVK